MRGCAMALAAGVLGLAAPSAAQAEITQVFTDTPTPVDCTVQSGANEGIRYCTNQSPEPRSTVATWDGVPIDVNVAFPPEDPYDPYDAYEEGPFPVMMLFHGYAGSKLGLGSMKHWLDQGYATFSITTRGNHQSCGTTAARTAGGAACDGGYLRLMDTRYEVRDAQELIALLVDEGLIDPGAIGATGGSYGGGMSMALAALRDRVMLPDGSLTDWESPNGTPLEIAGAAPDIPWTDLSYALAPNGGNLDYIADAPYLGHVDRVGVEKEAYVNALYASGADQRLLRARGAGPRGRHHRLEERSRHGRPLRRRGARDRRGDQLAPLLVRHRRLHQAGADADFERLYRRPLPGERGDPLLQPHRHHVSERPHRADVRRLRPSRAGRATPTTNAFISERKDEWLAHYVLGEGAEPDEGIDALTQSCGEPPAGPYHGTNVNDLAPGEITLESAPAQTIDVGGAAGDVLFGDSFGLFATLVRDGRCRRQPRRRDLQARCGARRRLHADGLAHGHRRLRPLRATTPRSPRGSWTSRLTTVRS